MLPGRLFFLSVAQEGEADVGLCFQSAYQKEEEREKES